MISLEAKTPEPTQRVSTPKSGMKRTREENAEKEEEEVVALTEPPVKRARLGEPQDFFFEILLTHARFSTEHSSAEIQCPSFLIVFLDHFALFKDVLKEHPQSSYTDFDENRKSLMHLVIELAAAGDFSPVEYVRALKAAAGKNWIKTVNSDHFGKEPLDYAAGSYKGQLAEILRSPYSGRGDR